MHMFTNWPNTQLNQLSMPCTLFSFISMQIVCYRIELNSYLRNFETGKSWSKCHIHNITKAKVIWQKATSHAKETLSNLLSYSHASRRWSCKVHVGPQFWGREVCRGQWWYRLKERWWFPISSPCDHCAISIHLAAICHRMTLTFKSTRVGHFGAKFEEEDVGRCKPNFSMIWERHGDVVCIRKHVDNFCRWAQCTNVTDRQTDRQTER